MGLLNRLSRKSPQQMNDRELKKKLEHGVGRNTGEDIATRARYIAEANKRGIETGKKKKD